MIPPALPPGPEEKDAENLRILAIFHFVFAGLFLLGLGFLVLHFSIMRMVFTIPQSMETPPPPGGPELREMFVVVQWFYLFFGLVILLWGVANVLSGLFILKRKHRLFSLIVAGINCGMLPFGTVLGVFTFLVLSRQSVVRCYVQPLSLA